MKTIVIDTETTGLGPNAEILQLAVIDGSGHVLMDELFKPTKTDVWPDAEAIHGIGPSDVEDRQVISELREKIQNIIDSADRIVGYNTEFDLRMLKRAGILIPLETDVVDVMQIFAEIYGEWNEYYENYKWQKLTTCATYYGYDWKDGHAHGALADCLATLYCMNAINHDL